jgi:hypothetical protein
MFILVWTTSQISQVISQTAVETIIEKLSWYLGNNLHSNHSIKNYAQNCYSERIYVIRYVKYKQ